MVETNGTSPVYIGGNDGMGFGGGGFIWAFLIFALLMGGGFGMGNRGFSNAIGYENLATSNEVQRGFDNQNAMANQREILSAVTSGTAQTVNAVNQTYHDTVTALSDKYSELARDVANVQLTQAQAIANQNQCCCEQKMLVAETASGINANLAQVRYDNAMNTASINANTAMQTQKILDVLSQNKIETLQNKVNQLELAQSLNGVVRYPSGMTYNAGTSPFCQPSCGCGYYS